MVNLQKIEIAYLEDCFDTMLYQIYLESLENCNFYAFVIFSYGSRRPSCAAHSHKFEGTPFADNSA